MLSTIAFVLLLSFLVTEVCNILNCKGRDYKNEHNLQRR